MLGDVGSVCRAFLPAWKVVFASGASQALVFGPESVEKRALNVWKCAGNFVTLRCRNYMDSGMARYINPFTDVGFKRIFGQE